MVLENTHTSTIAVYNSFTGDKIGSVPQSTEQDVLDALNLFILSYIQNDLLLKF